MAQTELISSRYHPKVLYAVAGFLVVASIAISIVYEQLTWAHPDLVEWCDLSKVESEAVKQHKPVLYYFTADWCGPCRKLKSEVFSNAESAAYINKNFIPCRVVDREMEDGKNTPAIKKIKKRYNIYSYPTMIAADWEVVGRPAEDLFAVSCNTQQILRNYEWSMPKRSGYRSKEETMSYLKDARLWTKCRPTRGTVHWKPNAAPWNNVGARPVFVAVLEQMEKQSNEARHYLLSAEFESDYINNNFDPYLLEFSRQGASPTQSLAEEARARYHLTKLPAFIVLNQKDEKEPAVSCGYASYASVLDFLERATHGKAKVPERKKEQEDEEEQE